MPESARPTMSFHLVREQGWASAALVIGCLALSFWLPGEPAITALYAFPIILASMGSHQAPMTVAAVIGTLGLLAAGSLRMADCCTISDVTSYGLGIAVPWFAWMLGYRIRQWRKKQADLSSQGQDFYKRYFDDVPIAMLQEDWSGVKEKVQDLIDSGVQDLEAYFHAHPDFFLEARKTHVFLDANQATVRLFGAPGKAELLSILPKLLPGKPESNIHVVRAMFNGDGFAQGERLLKTLDGREVPILWQVAIPPGRPDKLLFFAINTKELKSTQEALMAAQAELAHAARVAVLGELAASITHEVNQPLGAVKLFADSALRWIDRPEPNLERARNSIARVAKSAEQASEVMFRMRQFVRKSNPENIALNLQEILNDTVFLIEREATRHQVSIHLEIDEDVPQASGDRVQILQVLVNLALNAIHALGSSNSAERAVFIRVRRGDAGQVSIQVADTGPGIAPEILDRVFDPFFTTRKEGLGLGLAICRSIVEAHGGRVTARNGERHGAEFSFQLRRHDLVQAQEA